MPRDVDRFVLDQSEPIIDSTWIIQEARNIGLELAQAESETLLREVEMIHKSQTQAGKKVVLKELIFEKIEKKKAEKEDVGDFLKVFDEARVLYSQFGETKQEIFYIFDREKPNSVIGFVKKLKKRSLKGAKEYFEDLVIKYRKILDKIGAPFSDERRIFIIVGIGESARVVSANFKVTLTGEMYVKYEAGKRSQGASGKEESFYNYRTTHLDSVFLNREEAESSLAAI